MLNDGSGLVQICGQIHEQKKGNFVNLKKKTEILVTSKTKTESRLFASWDIYLQISPNTKYDDETPLDQSCSP